MFSVGMTIFVETLANDCRETEFSYVYVYIDQKSKLAWN